MHIWPFGKCRWRWLTCYQQIMIPLNGIQREAISFGSFKSFRGISLTFQHLTFNQIHNRRPFGATSIWGTLKTRHATSGDNLLDFAVAKLIKSLIELFTLFHTAWFHKMWVLRLQQIVEKFFYHIAESLFARSHANKTIQFLSGSIDAWQ